MKYFHRVKSDLPEDDHTIELIIIEPKNKLSKHEYNIIFNLLKDHAGNHGPKSINDTSFSLKNSKRHYNFGLFKGSKKNIKEWYIRIDSSLSEKNIEKIAKHLSEDLEDIGIEAGIYLETVRI